MTALSPFAALIDMTSNQTVAATSTITSLGWESVLDNAPTGHVTVPLGDAGDGFTSFSSFATMALSAAGGSGVPAMPAPLKLTLSLSGPNGAVDFEWVGFTVERKVASSELVLELAGECSYGALYSALPAGNGRTTMTDLALSDALSGAQGTIAPLDAAVQNRLLSADGTIPYLSGLLWSDVTVPATVPGLSSWDTAARQSITYSAVCASEVASVPVWLDSLADTVARAVQAVAQRLGGAVIPGDVPSGRPQGTRGHVVIDPSDLALNLSQWVT